MIGHSQFLWLRSVYIPFQNIYIRVPNAKIDCSRFPENPARSNSYPVMEKGTITSMASSIIYYRFCFSFQITKRKPFFPQHARRRNRARGPSRRVWEATTTAVQTPTQTTPHHVTRFFLSIYNLSELTETTQTKLLNRNFHCSGHARRTSASGHKTVRPHSRG